MKKWTCCLSVFALFLNVAGAKEKKVEIESPYEYVKNKQGETQIKSLPYLQRRPQWGIRLGLGTSNIELANEELPKKESAPFQIDIGIVKNFGLFSMGPEIGFTSAKFENTASFTAFNLGAALYLDGISRTSYVVPYASLGGMSISSKNGDIPCIADDGGDIPDECSLVGSEIIPYYRLGVLIGLNWIDKGTALKALADYGLQNSFIYFGMRKVTSTAESEGAFDLETTLYLEYGLQLEF